MKRDFDVDIDLADRTKLLEHIDYIPASIKRTDKFEKHNTGVYLQNIPSNPATGLSNIDHKEAVDLGYFKVDLLNVELYNNIKSEAHLTELFEREPNWDRLKEEWFVKELFHIGDYFHLVKHHEPRSIDQIAMILAIIRPAKKHLQYKSWEDIEKEVWVKPTDGSFAFKRSHSISYAAAVVVQMNLMEDVINGH